MRLTAREKELLDILKKEPLISQDELSQRLAISRSSIAVHISNLMKKGFILGKGYVFNERLTMVVIGENGLEIRITDENNHPQIDLGYGGISQQICLVLARFGANVKLITALGNDEAGRIIIKQLQESDIDTSNIYRSTDQRTCRKVIINGKTSYVEGFSASEYEKIVASRSGVISNCEWLIVEEEFQQLLVNLAIRGKSRMPMYCTYKSLNYPEEIPSYLCNYNVIVLGLENSQHIDYYINRLAQIDGLVSGIVTDGVSRVVSTDRTGLNDFLLPPNQSFNIHQKLPLFVAGLIYGLSMGQPLRQAVRIGTGTAT